MLVRIRSAMTDYPRQFWVLFWGQLINTIGGSMVWPFLTIFMRERLGVPLTTVTLLFTLNSAGGLVAMAIAGPAVGGFVTSVSYSFAFYAAAAASLLFVTLIVFKFIMTTNAAMVVLFQFAVTRWSQRYSPWRTLTLGGAFYAAGAGSVTLFHSFWGFWASMVVLTVGELLLAPTGSTIAANLAPADMRGRYRDCMVSPGAPALALRRSSAAISTTTSRQPRFGYLGWR